MQKDYIWNSATCSCENCKYLPTTSDDSVITCGEIIEEAKTVSKKCFILLICHKNESNDELKEIDIKNRTFYYSDDIIRVGDLAFDNTL